MEIFLKKYYGKRKKVTNILNIYIYIYIYIFIKVVLIFFLNSPLIGLRLGAIVLDD